MPGNRMPREHEFRIRNADLIDFDPKNCDYKYFRIGTMDDNDREEILALSRSDDRLSKYINILVNKGGPDGYDTLLEYFDDTTLRDDTRFANSLREVNVTQENIDPWYWFDAVDERVQQHVITDADASRVSLCLGKGWKVLLMELGIRQNDISMEEEKCRDMNGNICHLLIKWRHKQSKKATVKALVDKIRELDRDIEVDFERLRTAISKIEFEKN